VGRDTSALGVVVTREAVRFPLMAFRVVGGRIVAIDALAGPDRLQGLDLPGF